MVKHVVRAGECYEGGGVRIFLVLLCDCIWLINDYCATFGAAVGGEVVEQIITFGASGFFDLEFDFKFAGSTFVVARLHLLG